MPIKGLTDRQKLPRLGKIHLGVKKTNSAGKEYPSAVDYFVVPDEIKQYVGDQPKQLEIVLPVNDPEVFASTFYRAYSQSRGLVCKGNGEEANRLIDVATKRPEEDTGVVTGDIASRDAREVEWVENITCPGRACQYYQGKQCKELMCLQFVLPAVPGLGVWQLDTSSINSIMNIHSSVRMLQSALGNIAGIPLILSVEPQEVSPEGNKKTVYVLHIRSKMSFNELQAGHAAPALEVSKDTPPPDEEEMPELLYPNVAVEDATRREEPASGHAGDEFDTEFPPPVSYDDFVAWLKEQGERGVSYLKEYLKPQQGMTPSQVLRKWDKDGNHGGDFRELKNHIQYLLMNEPPAEHDQE